MTAPQSTQAILGKAIPPQPYGINAHPELTVHFPDSVPGSQPEDNACAATVFGADFAAAGQALQLSPFRRT
jgi:hypothetical protein